MPLERHSFESNLLFIGPPLTTPNEILFMKNPQSRLKEIIAELALIGLNPTVPLWLLLSS